MKVTAFETGFYKGSRIRPGASFEFDGDQPPRWTVPYGTPLPAKREAVPVDTKPPEAMAMAHGKTGMRGTAPSAYDIKPADASARAQAKSGAGTFPTSLG